MNDQLNNSSTSSSVSSFVLLSNQPQSSSSTTTEQQQQQQQSNYASAESSPTLESKGEKETPSKSNNFFQNISSAFDKIKFSIGNDNKTSKQQQKVSPSGDNNNESYIQVHKEKMQEIAIGIKEFSFEKTKNGKGNEEPKKIENNQFTFSLIDRMLARNSSLDNSPSTSVKQQQQPSADSPMNSNNSTLSAASSSSPNPDFSPFKLLPNEVNSTKSTISSNYMAKLTKEGESKLIENLSTLTHKEQEKVDPILSGAAKFTVKSPPTLPSSSHEFCMDLNLNLAAAAAHNSSGPVAVVGSVAKKSDDCYLEYNKFTSNASTCSIHNDLRKILEESNNKKLDQCNDNQTRSQRANHDSKHANPKSTEIGKTNDADLSKVLKMLIDSSKNQKRFRYSREFLFHVRDQRLELIDQLYPDIFKKYPTCKTGSKWDPEKYFDLITGFDDSRNDSKSKNVYKRNYLNQQKPSTSNNTNVIGNFLFNPKHMNSSTSDSPQPLQVPKNSPRFLVKDQLNELTMEINRKSSRATNKNNRMSDNVLTSLGLTESRQSDPDKYLLNLIKNDSKVNYNNNNNRHRMENSLPKEKVNILDMLNKSTKSAQEKKAKQDNDLLKSLLKDNMNKNSHHHQQQQQHQSRHFPKVYSVEELEQDQMSKLKKSSLPISAEELERKLTSPHKLDRPSPLSLLNSDPFKNSENPTKLLKQLLNLKPSDESKTKSNSDSESKSKTKSKKHRHRHSRKHQEKSDEENNSHHHHKSSKKLTKSSSEMPAVLQSILNPVKESNSLEKLLDKQLNNALDKFANSKRSGGATTSQSDNNIESLLKKINESKQKESKKSSRKQKDSEHFNALLNKMKPTSSVSSTSVSLSANSSLTQSATCSSSYTTESSSPEQKSSKISAVKEKREKKTDGSDILKWFCKTNKQPVTASQRSPSTTSEIELMKKLRQLPK